MLSIFLVLWAVSGVLLLGKLAYDISNEFTIRDLYMSLVGGFFGPFVLVFYLLFHPRCTPNKRLHPVLLQTLAALLIFLTTLYCTVVWLQNV